MEMENYSSLLHHKCHASLAYYNSNFEEALVFVIDRNGSIFFINSEAVARESESVFFANKKGINPILKNFSLELNKQTQRFNILSELKKYYNNCKINLHNYLGIVKVYEAATVLIGQDNLENGKTMGLSSYGKIKKDEKLFIGDTPNVSKFIIVEKKDGLNVCFKNCENKITKDINENNHKFYADKAKLVQTETQEQSLNLIKKHVKNTGIKNVCIVGGYGLNVVANNYYLKNLPNVNFYFEPVSDDAGIPVGATMLKYKEETSKKIIPSVNNFYHYYKKEKINVGKKSNLDEVCHLLKNQKSVAVFEGNPEAGPRALGHRSILFDARNTNAKNIVNKIKQREWYRPFAGVILHKFLFEVFEKLSIQESPYMTVNFEFKEKFKKTFRGITHVDNTCRIQTVKQGTLHNVLKLFYEQNNCPLLLNTSFNLAGQPLVQTINDAIKTWENSCLDAVYFVDEKRILLK
jgi:carbamoyltransferase